MTITYEFKTAQDAQNTIKFDYDVEPTADDVIDYFLADDSKGAWKTANIMRKFLDWSKLESDEWYVDFIRDRYEDKAREAFMRETQADDQH